MLQRLDRLDQPVTVERVWAFVLNRPEWWKLADWDREQSDRPED